MTLRAAGLSWTTGGARILDGVDLDVPAGRMIGLIGPNGSGKSTVLRCAAGLLRPSSGTVTVDGDDVGRLRPRAIARRLAFVEQDAATDVDLTVLEVALLGRTPHRRALEPDSAADRDLARDALARTGLTGREHQPWPTLSGGERQRARIARALVQQPRILLVDEPTNHLDIAHQLELLQLIRDLGLTTLAALHDLNHAAMFCDGLVVLDGGRVVAAGPPAEVLTAELLAAVYDVTAVIAEHPVTGTPAITYVPPRRGVSRGADAGGP